MVMDYFNKNKDFISVEMRGIKLQRYVLLSSEEDLLASQYRLSTGVVRYAPSAIRRVEFCIVSSLFSKDLLAEAYAVEP
ncbi:hypothetical protein JTB14_002874 [Gonioctena quinquepunctata]|nr:hypothetical protein JTB14_002874 [Gonioctena quinquepunctata]